MSMSSPERSTGWPEPVRDLGWDEWVAREAEHQADIEATFDRADEYRRLGDFAQALEWLDRASLLSGGLSPQYSRKHARLAHALGRGSR